MKTVFYLNGVVVGHATAHQDGVTVSSTVPGASTYQVDDTSPVDAGWTVTLDAGGNPTFTPPATRLPDLTPMQFYLAFAPKERMLIKALATTGLPVGSALLSPTNTAAIPADPIIAEFWATYELSVQLGNVIDPNLTSVSESVAYLASPTAPTPAVITSARIPQILAGAPQ